MSNFIAYQLAIEAAGAVGRCMGPIGKRDRDLEKQMRRATQSIALNLAEGARRRGQDRFHLFRIAAGSAAEVLAALDLAVAWGYLPEAEADPARELLDRLLAICWRLTKRKSPPSRAPSRQQSRRASSS